MATFSRPTLRTRPPRQLSPRPVAALRFRHPVSASVDPLDYGAGGAPTGAYSTRTADSRKTASFLGIWENPGPVRQGGRPALPRPT